MSERPRPSEAARTPGAFYDEMWTRWGHLDASSPAAFHRRRLVLSRVLELSPAAGRVLEVGCGQGLLLAALRARAPEMKLSGSDVSQRSLTATRACVGPNLELFELDLLAEDFESVHEARLGTYDVVVCSEVLEHLPDDVRALQRIGALLVPGGHAVLTVPGGRPSRFDLLIGHLRHYDPGSLRVLIGAAGMRSVEVMAWGFPFHNLYRSAVRLASRFALASSTGAPQQGPERGVLARLYARAGGALLPLYYANLPRWGEQLVAVARSGSTPT